MRYITAVYVPHKQKIKAEKLIANLRTPNTKDPYRLHLNGRWRHENDFSVYAFYSWWKPVEKFSGFITLCADRELKILYFGGASAHLDINGFKTLTASSRLSLLEKATLWAGVDQYFSQEEVLYPVRCYVNGMQEEPIEINAILGDITTVRIHKGSLYMFHVTDYKDLSALANTDVVFLVRIGTDDFIYSDNGLLPVQQGGSTDTIIELMSKYLKLA